MSYIFKKCSGGNADDVMKKILDPDNNPLGEGKIISDVYNIELEVGKINRNTGADRDGEGGFRMPDYIPIGSWKYVICNFETPSDGTNEICMIAFTEDYQSTGWFAYLEDGEVCNLAEAPEGSAYLRGYFSTTTATEAGPLTVNLVNDLTPPAEKAEHKKIYMADHGYSIYCDDIDDIPTMHKIVICAEGKDRNTYNITEIKAPRENPQEATLALMNRGNGFNQFVDFSSMVYDNYPEVVIVCQTRGGKQLPKFAIQFNDGGGRIDKLTVQPDAIPLELTSEGLKIRKDNSVGSGTEDDFVTVNLYDFFKNAITGGGD